MIIIFKNILFSIYAGIAITIAGAVNLIVGGLPGAILFAIGLLVVINYKELLFTG